MTSVILVLGASSWAPALLPIIGIVIGAVAAIVGGAFAACSSQSQLSLCLLSRLDQHKERRRIHGNCRTKLFNKIIIDAIVRKRA
jgi:hypothetical protein